MEDNMEDNIIIIINNIRNFNKYPSKKEMIEQGKSNFYIHASGFHLCRMRLSSSSW